MAQKISELFEPTIPFGEPELMRASTYLEYLKELRSNVSLSGFGPQLNPSLQEDLARIERNGCDGNGSEVVEVLAACLRHGKRVTVHLQCGTRVVPLTVFSRERLVHCPLPMNELIDKHLLELRVMHVEPALLRPPGDAQAELIGAEHQHFPLAPLLWELAVRGVRRELMPEIAGPATYRLAPDFNPASLATAGTMYNALLRLEHRSVTLREMACWPGLTRERAIRLLNALYLQCGLIVCRSNPIAASASRVSVHRI